MLSDLEGGEDFSSLSAVDLGLDRIRAVNNLADDGVASLIGVLEASSSGDIEVAAGTQIMPLRSVPLNLDRLSCSNHLEG